MRKSWKGLLLLLPLFAVLAYARVQIGTVGGNLQYLILAPTIAEPSPADQQGDSQTGEETEDTEDTEKTPSELSRLTASLDALKSGLQNTVTACTLSGISEGVSYSSDAGKTAQGRLEGLGEDAFAVNELFLSSGRLFYKEELQNGAKGILLDEGLSFALFGDLSSVGRTVTLDGNDYRVTGIVRHARRAGDREDYGAYIPLTALDAVSCPFTALMVSAVPVSGAGAATLFRSSMETWSSGGTMIDLKKEAMRSALPLRFFLCGIGFALALTGVRRIGAAVRSYAKKYRERLQREYAERLLPSLLGHAALFALAYAGLAGALYYLFSRMIEPVYTFTEYIPAVLVEYAEIVKTFWQAEKQNAAIVSIRSPEYLRLLFLGRLMRGTAVASALYLLLWNVRRRGNTLKSQH